MTDTLRADTAHIQHWVQQGDNFYDRDLAHSQESFITRLLDWLGQLFDFSIKRLDNDETFSWITGISAAIIITIVAYLLWKYRHNFKRHREDEEDETVVSFSISDDSIYGIDFNAELAQARERKDYAQAVRLVYLRTLRGLHDSSLLQWTDTKTPRELVQALQDASLRSAFERMTQRYVRIRYGHFHATETDLEHMLNDETAINATKGGER